MAALLCVSQMRGFGRIFNAVVAGLGWFACMLHWWWCQVEVVLKFQIGLLLTKARASPVGFLELRLPPPQQGVCWSLHLFNHIQQSKGKRGSVQYYLFILFYAQLTCAKSLKAFIVLPITEGQATSRNQWVAKRESIISVFISS